VVTPQIIQGRQLRIPMTGGPGSSRFQVDGQKHETTYRYVFFGDCYKGVLNVYPNISQYGS
jgi:hypothetical protein